MESVCREGWDPRLVQQEVIVLPCVRKCTRGRVIGVSVRMCVYLFVCRHKNDQFERNRPVVYMSSTCNV